MHLCDCGRHLVHPGFDNWSPSQRGGLHVDHTTSGDLQDKFIALNKSFHAGIEEWICFCNIALIFIFKHVCWSPAFFIFWPEIKISFHHKKGGYMFLTNTLHCSLPKKWTELIVTWQWYTLVEITKFMSLQWQGRLLPDPWVQTLDWWCLPAGWFLHSSDTASCCHPARCSCSQSRWHPQGRQRSATSCLASINNT